MTWELKPCFGCGTTKRVQNDFCQACEARIDETMRVSIRRIRSLETSLALTVNKLESIGLAVAERHRQIGALYRIRRLLNREEAGRINHAIQAIIRGLEMERPILVGRIARQRTYVDMMRRKLGVPR